VASQLDPVGKERHAGEGAWVLGPLFLKEKRTRVGESF